MENQKSAKELILEDLDIREDIALSKLAEQREEETIEFIDHSDDIWN